MFRKLRRNKQTLSLEDSIEILQRGTSGVLAVSGDNDYPYAVPLSYVYHNNTIIFHSAQTGHKLDAIARNPKVSFCVIDKDCIVPEKYTTFFRSVVIFGTAHTLDTEQEKKHALTLLAQKYAPDYEEQRHLQTVEKELSHVCMIELRIENISGKEAIELVRAKQ